MKEKIEQLKIFFQLTVAAFEFANCVSKAMGATDQPKKTKRMAELHQQALSILKGDIPDEEKLEKVDELLAAMELTASQPPFPSHDKGGISFGKPDESKFSAN